MSNGNQKAVYICKKAELERKEREGTEKFRSLSNIQFALQQRTGLTAQWCWFAVQPKSRIASGGSPLT